MKLFPVQALKKRGFIDKSFKEEGEIFEVFTKSNDEIEIEITCGKTVDFRTYNSQYVQVPGCNSIKDLDILLMLFNLHKSKQP